MKKYEYDGDVYMSDADMKYLSSEDRAAVENYKKGVLSGTLDKDVGNGLAEQIRKGYGYSGGADGSGYIPLYKNAAIDRLSGNYDKSSAYDKLLLAANAVDGKKQTAANNAASKYMGMSYEDFVKSDDYASLAKRYSDAGQAAMRDTLGEISARTGGLASSYATAASQAQYNDYMTRLEDAARSMYQNDLSNAAAQASFAQSQADTQYGRTQDLVNLFTTLENRDYEREQTQKAWDYQGAQDAEAKAQSEREQAAQYVLEYISMHGSAEGLNPTLIEASGLDSAYLGAYADRAKIALENEGRLSLSDAMSAASSGFSGTEIDKALADYFGEGYKYTPPVKSSYKPSDDDEGVEVSDYDTVKGGAYAIINTGGTREQIREELRNMFIDSYYTYGVDKKDVLKVISALSASGDIDPADRTWLEYEVFEKHEE